MACLGGGFRSPTASCLREAVAMQRSSMHQRFATPVTSVIPDHMADFGY